MASRKRSLNLTNEGRKKHQNPINITKSLEMCSRKRSLNSDSNKKHKVETSFSDVQSSSITLVPRRSKKKKAKGARDGAKAMVEMYCGMLGEASHSLGFPPEMRENSFIRDLREEHNLLKKLLISKEDAVKRAKKSVDIAYASVKMGCKDLQAARKPLAAIVLKDVLADMEEMVSLSKKFLIQKQKNLIISEKIFEDCKVNVERSSKLLYDTIRRRRRLNMKGMEKRGSIGIKTSI